MMAIDNHRSRASIWSDDTEEPGLWRCLADTIPDILLLIDKNGSIIYINRGVTGVSREDTLGTSVFRYLPASLEPELRASLEEIFAGAAPRAREIPLDDGSGTVRWFAAHTAAVRCMGTSDVALVIAREITDEKRSDAALHESEARYRTLVENAPEAIVVFDVDERRFVDANENACRMFGATRHELLRLDPIRLSPPRQPDGTPSDRAAFDFIEQALNGAIPVFDWMHRPLTGDDVCCEVRLVRLPAEKQRLVRGSITDVSAQRRIQEHITQLQKMEAIGQLASGIAHDFNNVLAMVSGSAELLARGLPSDEPLRLEAEWILSAARSGASLTRQLLTFARRQDSAPIAVKVNNVVDDVVLMTGRLLGGNIRIVRDLDPGNPEVLADGGQLEQVLMNLLLNSRDAMPDGGAIIVRTSRIRDRALSGLAGHGASRDAVLLRVTDTGSGMTEAIRRRVFEPFFTTKPEGKGTGLGLAIVYAIVKQCGGRIEVLSRPGSGTTFDVILPAVGGIDSGR
jgi:PAS domain S-box-containing protein